jgi:hypothetical protein
VLISGNEIDPGFPNDDCGILAVKSSRSFVKSENAGRTGYSWSVIITPRALGKSSASNERIKARNTSQLFRPATVKHMCRVTVLLNTLSLALCGPLRYGPGEETQKFTDRASLVEGKRRQVVCIAENNRGAGTGSEDN